MEMMAVQAQVVSCCLDENPTKVCNTWMATLHTCLTFRPFCQLISFYYVAPWVGHSHLFVLKLYDLNEKEAMDCPSVVQIQIFSICCGFRISSRNILASPHVLEKPIEYANDRAANASAALTETNY